MTVRLHINVDHVATLRNARGTPYPDPVRAARGVPRGGRGRDHGAPARGPPAHSTTTTSSGSARCARGCTTTFNLEMAATDEMVAHRAPREARRGARSSPSAARSARPRAVSTSSPAGAGAGAPRSSARGGGHQGEPLHRGGRRRRSSAPRDSASRRSSSTPASTRTPRAPASSRALASRRARERARARPRGRGRSRADASRTSPALVAHPGDRRAQHRPRRHRRRGLPRSEGDRASLSRSDRPRPPRPLDLT